MTIKSFPTSPDVWDINCIFALEDTRYKNESKTERKKMDFLKSILGEELYKQVESAVNDWNGNESNKDKQVKLANLSTGEYVSKGKYDGLSEQLTGKQSELDTANNLIADLKKATKGNEDLQGKITSYEGQVADLQQQLAETKLKSAIKVALLSEKAVDVDYLTFKLNEKLKKKGETLELDDNENIKGWDSHLDGLKTQFPNMFESGQKKVIEENRLPNNQNSGDTGLTQEQFNKMGYQSRLKLKQEQPELYNKMTGRE